MPWLSIIMAILSFLATLNKKKDNVGQAALVGAAAGLGTYYVTHETEWGRTNLGQLDGLVTDVTDSGEGTTTPTTIPSNGTTSGRGSTGSIWDSISDNLLPTAAGAAAGISLTSTKTGRYLLWGGFAVLALWVLKRERRT